MKADNLKHQDPILTDIEDETRSEIESALLSHDLRSALARVLSASQMLEGAPASETAGPYIAQIKSAALYMVDLLNTAQQEPQGNTDLAEALKQLDAIWQPAVAQKGLKLRVKSSQEMPETVLIPQIDFMRVMNNVIGNALKNSTEGDITMRLGGQGAQDLLIEVADEGPGFADDMATRIFTFRGRSESRDTEGYGYGLYICKAIMDKAGGDISAENRSLGGAKVSLVFRGLKAPRPVVSQSKGDLPDLSHLSILLAEDNPTNQLVATQMLKKLNARVETACDGVEAMALFKKGHFDLGLIDIEMPRKSGLEVMREIRDTGCPKESMKLVALTAYVLPEHKSRITAAGADGIIAKPLTDIAAFGHAILAAIGAPVAKAAAAPSSPDSDIDLAIYTSLKDIIGADSMRELLEKVKTDMVDVRAGLLDGLAQKDVLPIRAKTHILVSVAGAIGAVNLQHIAESLNATAKTEDWARITPELGRCEKGIEDVLRFVSAELDRE